MPYEDSSSPIDLRHNGAGAVNQRTRRNSLCVIVFCHVEEEELKDKVQSVQQCQKETQIYAGEGETVIVGTRRQLVEGLLNREEGGFSGEMQSSRDQKNSRDARDASEPGINSLALQPIGTLFVCLQHEPAEGLPISTTRIIRAALHRFYSFTVHTYSLHCFHFDSSCTCFEHCHCVLGNPSSKLSLPVQVEIQFILLTLRQTVQLWT